MSKIAHTISQWASALGMDHRTLSNRLTKASSGDIKKGQTFPARAVFDALINQEMPPRERLQLAQALEQERINRVEDGELVKLEDVEAVLTESVVLPLRQWLVSLPTTYDVRANQSDPKAARDALSQARDDCLKLLRDKLPPIKSKP